MRIRREILTADIFVGSSNAVTEDGKLFNIDATGNRVAPMMFGPKKVVLICGVNKIVKNLAEARNQGPGVDVADERQTPGIQAPLRSDGGLR